MSRSAAARAADHERARHPRAQAPAAARRVSGPLRPPRARVDPGGLAISDGALAPSPAPRPRMPSRPPLRLPAGGAAIALRVAEAAMEVTGSRTMDRLMRSRAWVVIVGFGLIGIVAMQVSMLKLNAGIGRAVETVATLERSNATLRGDVSRLSSGDRIQTLAGARGFSMPEPADVTYLRAGSLGSDGVRAARRMRAPDLAIAGPAGSAVRPASIAPAITGAQDPNAPAVDPAATPATTIDPAATPPTATDPAVAATAPAPTPPGATAASGATSASTAAPTAPAPTAPAPSAPQPASPGGVTIP